MKWSWRLGRIAGIDVFVHITFPLLLAWVGFNGFQANQSWAEALRGILFILVLFGIVVLHELGHALAARRYGIGTRDITLLPIGGVARLERMPDDPRQELVVALAGPAVNAVLAVGLVAIAVLAGGTAAMLGEFRIAGGSLLINLIWVNVALALFNLLPAFPMDGGRVLRALLAMRLDYAYATRIAATIGQGMALLFGVVGVFSSNWFLVLIALFVYLGAAAEASMVQARSTMGGVPVTHAMITQFQTLEPIDSLSTAVQHILAGFQEDFPVVDGDRLVGMLTRDGLLRAMANPGSGEQVLDVMNPAPITVDAGERLDRAFERMQAAGGASLPVIQDGRLVGILTPENVGEFLMIRTATRRSGQKRAVWEPATPTPPARTRQT